MSAIASEAGKAQQRALYGEPLSDRFDRISAAYGITHARLAEVLGLSPAMLSQLASGQRVKISNPAVYGRLLRLDELRRELGPDGTGRTAQDALASVSASRPELTTRPRASDASDASDGSAPESLEMMLARTVPYPELQQAAAETSGVLQHLLLRAAELAARPPAT